MDTSETLVVPGTPETGVPTDLALDVAGGQMYWTTAIEGIFGIYRAALDGSNVETLVPDPEGGVVGLALDVAGGQMYWTSPGQDLGQGIIYRAALDGSNIEPLVSGLNAPVMIFLAP